GPHHDELLLAAPGARGLKHTPVRDHRRSDAPLFEDTGSDPVQLSVSRVQAGNSKRGTAADDFGEPRFRLVKRWRGVAGRAARVPILPTDRPQLAIEADNEALRLGPGGRRRIELLLVEGHDDHVADDDRRTAAAVRGVVAPQIALPDLFPLVVESANGRLFRLSPQEIDVIRIHRWRGGGKGVELMLRMPRERIGARPERVTIRCIQAE